MDVPTETLAELRAVLARRDQGPHALLGVPVTASIGEVTSGFRTLVARYHPAHYPDDPELHRAATELITAVRVAYRSVRGQRPGDARVARLDTIGATPSAQRLIRLGMAQLRDRAWDRAATTFARAVAMAPASAVAAIYLCYARGWAALDRGDRDAARATWLDALRIASAPAAVRGSMAPVGSEVVEDAG